MAKFLRVKERLINLDSVDYIATDEGKDHKVRIVFTGAGTLDFAGDDADQLREYLNELSVVDRLPFFS